MTRFTLFDSASVVASFCLCASTGQESSHISDVRTSSQTWLYDIDEALVERVSRRVAELTRTPVSLQEARRIVVMFCWLCVIVRL